MLEVRKYRQADAERIGRLIADVYGEFNLREAEPDKRTSMPGPFAFANSSMPQHQEAIVNTISAPSVWVAEQGSEIAGVLRGGRTDERGRTVMSSLFVSGQHHRRGIGPALMERFEQEHAAQGTVVLKLSATLYAVPFYLRAGYKKSTGVRLTHSFGEPGPPYQPMKKMLG